VSRRAGDHRSGPGLAGALLACLLASAVAAEPPASTADDYADDYPDDYGADHDADHGADHDADHDADYDYDALYEHVFGHAPPDEYHVLDARLRIDRHGFGPVRVLVPLHGVRLRIEAEPLLAALAEVLLPEARQRVARLADESGRIGSEELRRLGIRVGFSERTLVLDLSTPAEVRRATLISVREPRRLVGRRLEPAAFSAYVNGSTRAFLGRDDRVTQFFTASANHRGTVLQSDLAVASSGDERFVLDRLELHRDDLPRGLRGIAGSIEGLALSPGFDEPLFGLSVAHLSSFAFFERPRPPLVETLEVDEPSSVDVFLNRRRIQSLAIDAGRHELHDFPFRNGVNIVEMRVVDADGRETSRRFRRVVWEQDILQEGEHQVVGGVGVPLAGRDLTRIDEPEDVTAAARYRYGLAPTLTLATSGKLAVERREWLVGAIYGGRRGLWELSTGLSSFRREPVQVAGELRFRSYRRPQRLGVGNYGAALRAETRRFAQTRSDEAARTRALSGYAYLDFRVLKDLWARTRVFYEHERSERSDAVGTNLGLRWRRFRALEVELIGDWRRPVGGGDDWFLTFRITHMPDTLGQRTQVNVLAPDGVTTLDWTHRRRVFDQLNARVRVEDDDNHLFRSELKQGDWRVGAQAEQRVGRQDVGADALYTGGRGRLRTRYTYFLDDDLRGADPHRGQVSADGALVFADGTFGLSRPVTGGFVILRPDERLGRATIRFSQNARSDWLSPAVVPNLRPLRANSVHVLDARLPPGAWIPERSYSTIPPPDAGYLVSVGRGGGILAEGALLAPDGAPLPYASGQVRSLDDPGGSPQPFFTGSTGAFSLPDLDPGRYRIELRSHELAVEFAVPETDEHYHLLGSLRTAPDPR